MKIILVGAHGTIGSAVVTELEENGHEVMLDVIQVITKWI